MSSRATRCASRAYLRSASDTTQVSDDEARKYFEAHRDEFTRNGMPLAFEEAEADAGSGRRRRVAHDRRAVAARPARALRGGDRYEPVSATRRTSSELKPAWLTIGATLLRRRR